MRWKWNRRAWSGPGVAGIRECVRGSGIALALALVVVAGCGSQPIPLSAIEGTTAAILIPMNFHHIGYGRALVKNANQSTAPAYDPNSPLEDPQRGELSFALYDGALHLGWLPLRYITRIEMSGASRGSVDLVSGVYAEGQTIAFVDIPRGLIPDPGGGDYEIKVYLMRRVVGDPNNYAGLSILETQTSAGQLWFGWGQYDPPPVISGQQAPAGSIPIHIAESLDDQDHFTPMHGWSDLYGTGLTWGDVADELNDLVPYPEFTIQVQQGGQPPPAAWEMEVSYPRRKLRVRGVTLLHPAESRALVRWDAGDSETSVSCSASPEFGTLKLRMIDPDRVATGVRVAYELRNFDQPCAGRASASDFAVVGPSFKAYDEDGAAIAGINPSIPASAFR